jgi:hypothetical protein
MRPTSRGNASGRKSLAATALQSRKPAGRNAQERLQNRHVTPAVRGMCVLGARSSREWNLGETPSPAGLTRGSILFAKNGPAAGGEICWCRRADSNRQPIAYEAIALPLSYCGVQEDFVSNFYQTSRPQLKRHNRWSPIGSELAHFFFDGCPGQARA